MRIHDEELGPMRWHLHMNGGRIIAEAVVETTRIQELLQNHQDVLEAKLNALGVEVENFEVSVDQGSQKFTLLTKQDHSRPIRPPSEDAPCQSNEEEPETRIARNPGQGLDLYV
jgi:flagellar hook-length control protein FliK